jgi:hypothetical protein
MRARQNPLNWGAIAAASLRLLGWLSVNALAAAGIIARTAFALGSFSLPLTMAQLANLADRYVVASALRQGQFNHIVLWGFATAFVGVAFFRRAGLAAAISTVENEYG